MALYRNSDISTASYSLNARNQLAALFDGSNGVIAINGTSGSASASTGTFALPGTLVLGGDVSNTNQYVSGYIPELLIVAGAVVSGDQAAIRSSQQTAFGTG